MAAMPHSASLILMIAYQTIVPSSATAPPQSHARKKAVRPPPLPVSFSLQAGQTTAPPSAKYVSVMLALHTAQVCPDDGVENSTRSNWRGPPGPGCASSLTGGRV